MHTHMHVRPVTLLLRNPVAGVVEARCQSVDAQMGSLLHVLNDRAFHLGGFLGWGALRRAIVSRVGGLRVDG